MPDCLWCATKIEHALTWSSFLAPKQPIPLCAECDRQFSFIDSPHCIKCYRTTELEICADCKKWHEFYNGADPLTYNISIFTYNKFMKDVITKWKYRGDYELVHLFSDCFVTQFKKAFIRSGINPLIIPIPLSEARLYHRGFNQSHALAQLLTGKVEAPFSRIENEKQSKKTRSERMTSMNPFTLSHRIERPVVIIDDIYTTGRTIRHAAELLRKKGCKEIYSYTLIRG